MGYKPKILVTGAAGFIGSSLIEKLVKNGSYKIYGIDIKKNPVNLKPVIDKIRYLRIDVRDADELEKAINDIEPDGVIHLAAVSRVIWCEHSPDKCIDVNISGTRNIIKIISKLKNKPWIIYGSSREVYGEPIYLPVKEEHRKAPINIYGWTKAIGESIVRDYATKIGFNAIILRFSNVYGSEKDVLDRVIPRFIIRAIKGLPLIIQGGDQVFDFTHISDTVNGITKSIVKLSSVDNSKPYINDFHILTGKPTPIKELPIILEKCLNKKIKIEYRPPRNYDVVRFYGNPSKAELELGFRARIWIKDGICMTVRRLLKVI